MGKREGEKADPSPSRDRSLFCPHCSYNLTGLPHNRCPECGAEFDPAELARFPRYLREPIYPRQLVLRILCLPVGYMGLAERMFVARAMNDSSVDPGQYERSLYPSLTSPRPIR